MRVGIYISGLGQSFVNESVEKYAERFKNEIKYNTTGIEYEIKTETVNYSTDRSSTVVSICEQNGQNKVVYKFYEFKYNKILTEKFNNYPLIWKNLWLFLLVAKKSPLIIKRLFSPQSYNRPFQTLYLFFIFFVIASAILLMLPAIFEVISTSQISEAIINVKNTICAKDIPFFSQVWIENISKTISPVIVSVTALLLLLIPQANILVTSLANEFVCANNYLQYGTQKQLLQGNLELLVDYISEKEQDCKIHFHSYSFGSVLALDYIYPFGTNVTRNTELHSEAIITIGSPYEFIKSYYPKFYQNRKKELGDKIHWINVYSIADALATNFRKDSKIGDAEFGIEKDSNKPININYEVADLNKNSVIDFFMLHSLKAHGMYWDKNTEGQSCLRLILDEMSKRKLI